MQKSFTLIELLVVIAIVGLLASIVLVSTQGVQSKAKITKLLEFSQSLQSSLGAYAVGVWSFDDQTNPTKDGSGYNNNCSVTEAIYDSNTPHQAGGGSGNGKWALRFDGSNDYLNCGSGSSMTLATKATIEAWIYQIGRGISSNWPSIAGKGQFRIYHNGGSSDMVAYVVVNGTGHWPVFTSNNPLNQWHHLVVSFDGTLASQNIKLYYDGKLVNTENAPGTLSAGSETVYIGGAIGGISFNGLIDEVRIYGTALTLGEIQEHYAEGLKGHQNLAIK